MSDWSSTYNGFLNPQAEILIESNKPKQSMQILSIYVEKSVGFEASTCVIKVKAEKSVSKGYIPTFFSDLKPYAKIEVKLGYSGALKTVFVGYIVVIDLEIASEAMTVCMRCMDGKILMMSNLKSELKKGVTNYSGAVKDVFRDYAGKFSGSNVQVSGEPKLNVPVYQVGESDYDFVCKMASKAGALFFIDNGIFNFVDMYSAKSSNESFRRSDIAKIKTSIDLGGISKKVETVAQDRKHFKKVIKGATSKSDDLGKGKDAASLSKNVSGTITLRDSTIVSEKEAEFASQAEQNRRNFNMVTTKVCLMHGIPDLELSKIYKIEKIGKPVDNEYVLTAIVHKMSENGYASTLHLNSTRYNSPGSVLSGLSTLGF